MKLNIGLQGNLGSSNHRAAIQFAKRHGWRDYQLVSLTTTKNVLQELKNNSIDYGTFAWESTKGMVLETQEAIKEYSYQKVDELRLEINHALLINTSVSFNPNLPVEVVSHPQALISHREFIQNYFNEVEFREEIDTAYAAERLSLGCYKPNSVVIAPIESAEIYALEIFMESLPSNEGLWTIIYLVKSAM